MPEPAQGGRDAWLATLLARAERERASDVHVLSGETPRLRLAGAITALEDMPRLEREDVEAALARILPPGLADDLRQGKEVDFRYVLLDGTRFRVSAFWERRGVSVHFRQLADRAPALADLTLPLDLARACYAPDGLVIFAGHAGSGKSATLAAVLQEFCSRRTARLITLEDPIEYRLEPRRAYVEQRGLGEHFRSYDVGVREAIDAGPDALAIAELRDAETIRLALQAAEAGILVFASVHAYDVMRTIGRLVDAFSLDERLAVRVSLAGTIRMMVAQTLLKRARGDGRVPALEICHRSASLATLIREGKEHEIGTLLESNRGRGMRTLDDSLLDLVRQALVSPEEAMFFAVRKDQVQRLLDAGHAGVAAPGTQGQRRNE